MICKTRIVQEISKTFQPNFALTNVFVSINLAFKTFLRII